MRERACGRARKPFFLAATFALLSAVAAAAQSAEFSGEWQTFWRAGTATLTLTQEGDAVTGSYEPFDGSVTGTVEGRVPSGT